MRMRYCKYDTIEKHNLCTVLQLHDDSTSSTTNIIDINTSIIINININISVCVCVLSWMNHGMTQSKRTLIT